MTTTKIKIKIQKKNVSGKTQWMFRVWKDGELDSVFSAPKDAADLREKLCKVASDYERDLFGKESDK